MRLQEAISAAREDHDDNSDIPPLVRHLLLHPLYYICSTLNSSTALPYLTASRLPSLRPQHGPGA